MPRSRPKADGEPGGEGSGRAGECSERPGSETAAGGGGERAGALELVEEDCEESLAESSMNHWACLQSLDGAMLASIWPPQSVVMGIMVCKWTRAELLAHSSVAEFSSRGVEPCEFREAGSKEVHSVVDFMGLESNFSASGVGKKIAETEQEKSSDAKRNNFSHELGREVEESVRTSLLRFQHTEFTFSLNLPSQEHTAEAIVGGVQSAGMCRALSALSLSKTSPGFLVKILEMLQDCSALKALSFGESDAGFPGRGLLFAPNGGPDFAAHCPNLSSLHLGFNQLVAREACSLLQFLPRLSISELHLGASGLFRRSNDLEVLDRVLPQLTTLRRLNLGVQNKIRLGDRPTSDSVGLLVGMMLSKCTSLQYLDLGENQLQAPKLDTALPLVQELRLGNNWITPFGIRTLAGCIQDWEQLRVLHLGRNKLGDGGFRTLCAHLCRHPALRALRLGQNNISSSGAQALSNCLKMTTNIEELHLGKNEIGDQGFFALVGWDGGMQCSNGVNWIKTLHLGRNNITSDAFERVRQGSVHIPLFRWGLSLTSLHLGRNKIDDQALVCLAADLQFRINPLPLMLNLGSNQVRDRGLKTVVEAVLDHQPKTCVDFGKNFFSPFACARAQASLYQED